MRQSTNKEIRHRLRHCLLFVFIIGTMTFASSCSSERKTTGSGIRSYSANYIVKEIEENSFNYDVLQAKLDIKFKDNKNSLGLKGQLRMQKDSVIWISLSLKVGVEVGRLMITPDSVKFLNRSNKTYLAENISFFNEKLPIDASIDFFQDLFVGNDSQIGNDNKYRVSTDDDKYKLETVNNVKKNDTFSFLKDIWVTPNTFRISRYRIEENVDDRRNISLEYADFERYNDKLLPSKIKFELNSGNNTTVEIEYSNVTVNEDVVFPFNVTKKFDRIYLW